MKVFVMTLKVICKLDIFTMAQFLVLRKFMRHIFIFSLRGPWSTMSRDVPVNAKFYVIDLIGSSLQSGILDKLNFAEMHTFRSTRIIFSRSDQRRVLKEPSF